MKLSRLLAFFVIITTLLIPAALRAQTGSGEVIHSFHSKIIVHKDTSMTVT
ncbi:MAG: hypothetical protein ACYC0V_20535 [Armatimonadota bacterium]